MKFLNLIRKPQYNIILTIITFPLFQYLLGSRFSILPTLLSLIYAGIYNRSQLYIFFKFCYNVFLKTSEGVSGVNQHADRLNSFYSGQVDVYDETRRYLLRGRKTMLRLCTAQLLQSFQVSNNNTGKPLIWIDIGSGTGWAIEQMDAIFPISNFERIYSVDITPSLSAKATERFQRLGWKNVTVICADATSCPFPGLENTEGQVALITTSYSLSMMEQIYPVVDRIQTLLDPEMGIFGVSDFYTSGKNSHPCGLERHTNWFTRWFWQMWFELDHVYLHPSRREYLEYRFQTVKDVNFRNSFGIPISYGIPYYAWVGKSKCVQTETQISHSLQQTQNGGIDKRLLSRTESRWRLPYDPNLKCHTQFNSYIYAFTWEDPAEDLKVLNLTPNDEILLITSAGDNLLDYLCQSGVKRIHSVDINPNQNHLLELKMAALNVLTYEDFWLLFGEGRYPCFPKILDQKLSPHLSSEAYQFWKKNQSRFNSSFYETGGSGYAIQVMNWLKKLLGKPEDMTEFLQAKTMDEQIQIYQTKIRHIFTNKLMLNLIDNPLFLWLSSGVPMKQRRMLKTGKSFYEFMFHSFESCIATYHTLKDNVYFRYMGFMGCYSKECCPNYLKEEGFRRLQSEGRMDGVMIHTSSILDVLKSMQDKNLSKAVLMDHMDWFSRQDAQDEIAELSRVIKKNGFVLWRSFAEEPWYNEIFNEHGFLVEPVAIRDYSSNVALDRVNTYASFYRATKL